MDAVILNTLGNEAKRAKIPVLSKGRAAISYAIIRMRYKRKVIILAIVLILLSVVQYAMPEFPQVQAFYASYIFRPWQGLRNMALGRIPLSIGDLLYLFGALALIAVVIRWMYFLLRFRSHKHYLGASLLNTIITITIIYALFYAGWGGNYYKPTLAKHWGITMPVNSSRDSSDLADYDRFLIAKLNALAPGYSPQSFPTVNRNAQAYYRAFTNSPTRTHGLSAKPSIFGYFMQYMGIQGYYNPFTGEAQVNRFLPSFMLPFVVTHEMAHQSGIAAEEDANLLAYALCTRAPNKDFAYSGYFNLWLYTHARLKKLDSVVANTFLATLNPLAMAQLDTLRAIRRKYRGEVSSFSAGLYDSYLRLHHQKDGIESYSKAALTAWAWERQKGKIAGVISVP